MVMETWGNSTISRESSEIQQKLNVCLFSLQLGYKDQQQLVQECGNWRAEECPNKEENYRRGECQPGPQKRNRQGHSSLKEELETQSSDLKGKSNALMKRNLVLKERVQELTKVSVDCDEYQFKIFRGNKKLLPEEANKAAQRQNHAKCSSFAENFTEIDFKKATKNFNVSNDSAQMMQVFQNFGLHVMERNEAANQSQYEHGPHMLISSPYYDTAE
ncbi:hypothetical protein MMC29_000467 [Sticta canariensis]|nr:hypothetical protein [Sticta canariensis]